MNISATVEELSRRIAALPMLDAHTHLVGGKLGARGLHDILLYHMVVSDLYGAGCPSGSRLSQYPLWPDREEAHARLREAVPYLRHIRNTSMYWGVRIILADLYDWHDEISEDNWLKLDALVRERADDKAWQRAVIQRTGIQRICTEYARREARDDGELPDSDLLQYSSSGHSLREASGANMIRPSMNLSAAGAGRRKVRHPLAVFARRPNASYEPSMTCMRRLTGMWDVSRRAKFSRTPRTFPRMSISSS